MTDQEQRIALCRALLKWRDYFQSDIPATIDQQEEQAEKFTEAWFDMEKALENCEDCPTKP